jgi:hypothetical protein
VKIGCADKMLAGPNRVLLPFDPVGRRP